MLICTVESVSGEDRHLAVDVDDEAVHRHDADDVCEEELRYSGWRGGTQTGHCVQ